MWRSLEGPSPLCSSAMSVPHTWARCTDKYGRTGLNRTPARYIERTSGAIVTGSAGLGTVGLGVRSLAEVLEPGSLHAWIVGSCLYLVHEVRDVGVEAFLQSRISDATAAVERLMRLRKAEHVRVD